MLVTEAATTLPTVAVIPVPYVSKGLYILPVLVVQENNRARLPACFQHTYVKAAERFGWIRVKNPSLRRAEVPVFITQHVVTYHVRILVTYGRDEICMKTTTDVRQ